MAMTLITTNTSSGAASSSFTSSIDSTYKLYIFKFINIHNDVDGDNFAFNGSTDGGSNYNVTKTTTYFRTEHYENDSGGTLLYLTAFDLAQSTAYQTLARDVANGSDECCAGTLWLFNPSNTTYVKHFYSTTQNNGESGALSSEVFTAGYFNTTDNIDAIDFKMESGNMDAVIKMYGVS